MPVRILLVDDFAPFRAFVSSLLEEPEYQVVGEAADGIDGLRQATQMQPDLILLDIGLPHMHGLEVAKRVQTASPQSKIVFVTEAQSASLACEALRCGQGYVVKASSDRELLTAIQTVVKGGRFLSNSLSEHLGGEDL